MTSKRVSKAKVKQLYHSAKRYLSKPTEEQAETIARAIVEEPEVVQLGKTTVSTLQDSFGIYQADREAFEPQPVIENISPPEDLLSMLERLHRATGCLDQDDENEALVRSRLDMIFIASIDTVQNTCGRTCAPIKLQYETTLECTVVKEGIATKRFTGKVDYSIGYGKPDQPEANLAIIEAKGPTTFSRARTQLLGYLGMYYPLTA
ncbi:hypothetical protein ASPVEDRAFT_83609 [Aspergillus versicolor CBS 583.65]|uniref:Uncharacterized protein n=1 Tax=Aspergillus versicolor CBS 583.65 TaxID=1036611 RepID=A0A1L9PKN4_ASPVE|nr:uncharacterized protein ASPVEDRAFT_83609 [Aspergillus versicolor CBS 583.65]OJJ02090.1 hypothetical protein ASPVEDRAFT_83609 [Aspergillus versicolor CBS 583.65]